MNMYESFVILIWILLGKWCEYRVIAYDRVVNGEKCEKN